LKDKDVMAATLPAAKRKITKADILPMAEYGRERAALRQNVVAIKRARRVEVGPVATFYFESFQTMWHQVHEMLFIEKGGDAQIEDELRAYNPLIPQGNELVATVMFEIDDPVRRATTLLKLGGIEHKMFVTVGGETVRGEPEGDVERTKSNGKTSSVHFVHFRFTPAQIAKFRAPGVQVVLGFDHPEYGHMTALSDATRIALAADFAA
jgi:Protein of unknown function (DUF3501)